MEAGPGLSQAEIAALFTEAADPAVAFLYDDKVREALVGQICDWTGCQPVFVRLGLWTAQQAAAGIAASGVQWLGGRLGAAAAAALLRCPGCDRLASGLRRLFRKARDEAAFRAEIDAIARGERDPDLAHLPDDAPDDVKLAVRLLQDVSSLAGYLPGEFDALYTEIAALRGLLERPDPTPIARPLPAAPHLVGREQQLAGLVALLLDPSDPRPVLVRGGPGVGKTALTLGAAHDPAVVTAFPRRLFVPLVAVPSGAGIVDAVAGELGLVIGADRDGRTLAALHDSPTLLVLDNLETPLHHDGGGTGRELGCLAGIPGLRVLASIRGTGTPGGVRWQVPGEVRPLDRGAARDLFIAESPAAADDPALNVLLTKLGGVPLALILLARRHRDGDGDAGELLEQWEQQRTAVAWHGTKDQPETDLAAAIEMSVQSRRLDHNAGRRLFTLMGRLPDGMALADRKALLAGDEFEAASALKATGLAFADDEQCTRLRMLPPVQAHAAGSPLDPEQEARLVGHYLDLARALPEGSNIRPPRIGRRNYVRVPSCAISRICLTPRSASWARRACRILHHSCGRSPWRPPPSPTTG